MRARGRDHQNAGSQGVPLDFIVICDFVNLPH